MVPANPQPPRHASNRVARVAFALTLVFLAAGLLLGILGLRSLGVWQLGGTASSSSETFALLAAICLFTAMAFNATAFVASLWGWWHGRRPELVLIVSGLGILASLGCGLSFLP
jgi:hypothetical protein